MMDQETKSLWSHLLGKSMKGELIDTQLEAVPSLLTDWETWKRTNPKTSVMLLSRTANQFNRKLYGELRYFVVGMKSGSRAKAWSINDLNRQPIVNDQFDGAPLVIWFNKKSVTPFFFSRQLDKQQLTFVRTDGVTKDEQTGSTWDLENGVATDGELKGESLQPLAGIMSFKKSWYAFFPNSETWKRTE